MNGFTGHQASDASETSGHNGLVLTWAAAQSMLPLVRQIVADILRHGERLASLRPEKGRLDRARLSLAWPERRRRYQLTEEIGHAEAALSAARAEMDGLGLALIDADLGQVGFPTIVNNRRAYFSWRPGDDDLGYWHFNEGTQRRRVPESWKEPDEEPRPGKRRPNRS